MSDNVYGHSFWNNSAPEAQYPWLDHDEHCDVAIIGGGIAGCMCALKFSTAGISTVLLSENPVGYGGSAAAQGVISYQLNGGLTGLAKKQGMDTAVKIFELCKGAVDEMDTLCDEMDAVVGFARRDCLYYTSDPSSAENMKQEYLSRRHNGFPVEFLDSAGAREKYSFPIAAGIVSASMAAECDPYRLTHGIATLAEEHGAKIFENTKIDEVTLENGTVELCTGFHKKIYAKKIIMAAGVETARHLPGTCTTRSTFTIVTKPVPDFAGWNGQAVLCSDEQPSIRLRTTPDNRIIISGLDCGTISIGRIASMLSLQKLTAKKFSDLESRLISMFPAIRSIQPEFSFSFDYPATLDGLPVIGESENPNVYYALCTGENGIAYSIIAANMLLQHYQGNTNPDMFLFASDR